MQSLGGGIKKTRKSRSLYLMPTGPDPTKGLEHLVDEMWPATRVRLYDFPNHVIYRVDAAPVPFALGNALFMQPDGSPGWRATKEHGADVPYPPLPMQHVHVCTYICIYTYKGSSFSFR